MRREQQSSAAEPRQETRNCEKNLRMNTSREVSAMRWPIQPRGP